MRESIKAFCGLVMIVGLFMAVLVWTDDRPNSTTWILRWCSLLLMVAPLALLIKLHFKRDIAPDLLKQQVGDYFNCGGFCFAFSSSGGLSPPQLHAWFQNQYERPCTARITLTPARQFWMNRPAIEEIAIPVSCAGGVYGVASVPLLSNDEVAGKKIWFEVSAEVGYPGRRGRRLRFHDGMQVGLSRISYLTALAPLAGVLVWYKPAKFAMEMPPAVPHDPSASCAPTVEIHWTPSVPKSERN